MKVSWASLKAGPSFLYLNRQHGTFHVGIPEETPAKDQASICHLAPVKAHPPTPRAWSQTCPSAIQDLRVHEGFRSLEVGAGLRVEGKLVSLKAL